MTNTKVDSLIARYGALERELQETKGAGTSADGWREAAITLGEMAAIARGVTDAIERQEWAND
jgi:hypothetical protein